MSSSGTSYSSMKNPATIVGIVVGLLALVLIVIGLIVALKEEKKPVPTTVPSTNLVPTTSTAITTAGPSYGAQGAAAAQVPIAPSVAAGCGCSPGVGYGAEYLENHPLQQTGPLVHKGCKRADAANYDGSYNSVPTIDGCQEKIFGCTDEHAWNYMPWANTTYPGACWYPPKKHGCTDKNAFNYDPRAQVDNGSCIPRIAGCTSIYAANYNPHANTDDGSCVAFRLGCTNPSSTNYDPDATIDSGECVSPGKTGCTVLGFDNYDQFARFDDGSCCGKRDGMIQCGNPFAKADVDPATAQTAGDCGFCAK